MDLNVLLFVCEEADHCLNLNLEFEGQTLTLFFSMSPFIIAKAYFFLFSSLSVVSCECLFPLSSAGIK